MSFLIDLYALEAVRRPALLPPAARQWLAETPIDNVSIAGASLDDYGLSIASFSKMAPDLAGVMASWVRHVVKPALSGRILPCDSATALAAIRLPAPPDATLATNIVAATALVHGLTLVTPYPEDYAHTGVPVLALWA